MKAKVKIDIWKEIEQEYKFWSSLKGCQLHDKWVYEALLDLNNRLKEIEKKK